MQKKVNEAVSETISRQEARATYIEMTKRVREAATTLFMELNGLGQFADDNLDCRIPDTEIQVLTGCSKVCEGIEAVLKGIDMIEAVTLEYTTPLAS
jgi:hypothetical protein